MTITVALDRTSLGLTPLTVTGSAPAGDGYFLTQGGITLPAFDVRATYAPDSAYVAGSQLLAAVLAASTLPLVVAAQASTSTALADLQATLATALWQFTYQLTLTVDGVATTWEAGPCWPNWGELTSPFVEVHMATANLAIPVNP